MRQSKRRLLGSIGNPLTVFADTSVGFGPQDGHSPCRPSSFDHSAIGAEVHVILHFGRAWPAARGAMAAYKRRGPR